MPTMLPIKSNSGGNANMKNRMGIMHRNKLTMTRMERPAYSKVGRECLIFNEFSLQKLQHKEAGDIFDPHQDHNPQQIYLQSQFQCT